MSTHVHIPLEENCFYHIYNRGNGATNLFFCDQNYIYFMRKYREYMSGIVDTYAYCLLPNHFHMLVYVKSKKDFTGWEKAFPNKDVFDRLSAAEIVSELLRRFFMSYSKAINVQEQRNGSLFQKNFRRKLVQQEGYFEQVVYYIHRQLEHHRFNNADYSTYKWSSYSDIVGDDGSDSTVQELFKRFGGKHAFIKIHQTGFRNGFRPEVEIEEQ